MHLSGCFAGEWRFCGWQCIQPQFILIGVSLSAPIYGTQLFIVEIRYDILEGFIGFQLLCCYLLGCLVSGKLGSLCLLRTI